MNSEQTAQEGASMTKAERCLRRADALRLAISYHEAFCKLPPNSDDVLRTAGKIFDWIVEES